MLIDFSKSNGLVPVVIQHYINLEVLMLGYMNQEAFDKTNEDGKVCFYSRSKQRLWTKGESSGNFLYVKNIDIDCDQDTLLIQVDPAGPVCHKGSVNCFNNSSAKGFIYELENIIEKRSYENEDQSYTKSLLNKGINKVSQKFGEEAVELIIEAKDQNDNLFKEECADLLYHLFVLLKAKEIKFQEVETVLQSRNTKK